MTMKENMVTRLVPISNIHVVHKRALVTESATLLGDEVTGGGANWWWWWWRRRGVQSSSFSIRGVYLLSNPYTST